MHNLFGRRQIFCDEPVTIENAVSILHDALQSHAMNRAEIDYLYHYYKGKQPILDRVKQEYMASCNKIVVNRANEIVNFKDGYLIGEPVQYISRGEGDETSDEINQLNAFMDAADKAAEDMSLVNWMHISGTAYRMVLPRPGDTEQPFSLATLDPRNTFVVYLNDVRKTPQMAVNYVERRDGVKVYTCYLKDLSFEVRSTAPYVDIRTAATVESVKEYRSPVIPIVEFIANPERMGVFETVLPLLDAISTAESNRLDGVEQFVQAILCFVGTDLDEEQLTKLLHLRTIALPPSNNSNHIDVKYLVQELNQEQTQILIDDMYDTVLDICGVPSRSGGASTSDTGAAVIMREGWSSAEGRAKVTELMFKRADREVMRGVLEILRVNQGFNLNVNQIETKFSRHNYEGLTVKSSALVAMLGCGKIHPQDAFQQSNLFIDSEAAYTRGMEWYEKTKPEVQDASVTATAGDAGINPANPE